MTVFKEITLQSHLNPKSYEMDFSVTKKVWDSNDFFSKTARISLIGIALIALTETIIELVKMPFKFIGNQFDSCKILLFKKEKESQIKSEDENITDKLKKFEFLKEQNKTEQKKLTTWKKVVFIGLGLLTIGLIGWGGITAYQIYNSSSHSTTKLPDVLNDNSNDKCSNTINSNSQDEFVKHFEEANQCPTIEGFIKDQKDKNYWGWTLDNMKRLFGSDRDLSLQESRLSFYHGQIQKNIPVILKAHPRFISGKVESLPEEVARDISELRDVARNYTRQRSDEEIQKWLEMHEPRNNGFEYYWEKYSHNPKKVIEGTMKSNGFYDNPLVLKISDAFIYYAPNFLKSFILKN